MKNKYEIVLYKPKISFRCPYPSMDSVRVQFYQLLFHSIAEVLLEVKKEKQNE